MLNDDLLDAANQALGEKKSKKTTTSFDRQRIAIEQGAAALGIDPVDYATAISYESAGTFDPWAKGTVTKWGLHRGTIQYGEPQRKQYGVYEGQTFEDQVTNSNVRYLKDKGVKPGATFAEIYAAINGGNTKANLSTKDANTGRTIADNIRNAENHRSKVLKRFWGGLRPEEKLLQEVDTILSKSSDTKGVASQPDFQPQPDILGRQQQRKNLEQKLAKANNLKIKREITQAIRKLDQTIYEEAAKIATPISSQEASKLPVSKTIEVDQTNKIAPVPENPVTLNAQKESAKRDDSPRIAVLYTGGEQIEPLTEEEKRILFDVQLENGEILRINRQKAREFFGQDLSPLGIKGFVRSNGYADLIAKAENVGTKTDSGSAVVARDGDGNELSASVVTNPHTAEKQFAINQAEFGEVDQSIEPVQNVVDQRQNRDIYSQSANLPSGFQSEPDAEYMKQFYQPSPTVPVTQTIQSVPETENPIYNVQSDTTPTPTYAEQRGDEVEKLPENYLEYLKYSEQTDSPKAREEYNQIQKRTIGEANRLNQKNVQRYNVGGQKQSQSQPKQVVQSAISDSPTEIKDEVVTLNLKDKPSNASLKNWVQEYFIPRITSKYGIEAQDVASVLNDRNYSTFEADLQKQIGEDGLFDATVPAAMIATMKKTQAGRKEYESRLANAKQRIANGEPEEDALLLAGVIDSEKYRQLQSEIAQAEKEEQEALARFEKENREIINQNPDWLSSYEGWINPSDVIAQQQKEADERFARRKEEIITKYANTKTPFSKHFKEEARKEKEYEFRPMARPSEAVMSVARYLGSLPFKAAQVATVVATDANPLNLAFRNEDEVMKATETPFYQFAESQLKRIEKSKNKDFEGEYATDLIPNGIAQLGTQIVAGTLTGGWSLAIPLGEAGLSEYKEAEKAGADRKSRAIAFGVGGAAAAPDAILTYFLALRPIAKIGFLEKYGQRFFANISKVAPVEKARQLTADAMKGFLNTTAKKAVARGVAGGFTEREQERLEDRINKFTASVTYNPKITWDDIFTSTEAEERGYNAAGIIGMFGGNVQTVVEKMDSSELEKSDEVIANALKQGLVKQDEVLELAKAIQVEAKKRNIQLPPQGTVEELVNQATETFSKNLPQEKVQSQESKVQVGEGIKQDTLASARKEDLEGVSEETKFSPTAKSEQPKPVVAEKASEESTPVQPAVESAKTPAKTISAVPDFDRQKFEQYRAENFPYNDASPESIRDEMIADSKRMIEKKFDLEATVLTATNKKEREKAQKEAETLQNNLDYRIEEAEKAFGKETADYVKSLDYEKAEIQQPSAPVDKGENVSTPKTTKVEKVKTVREMLEQDAVTSIKPTNESLTETPKTPKIPKVAELGNKLFPKKADISKQIGNKFDELFESPSNNNLGKIQNDFKSKLTPIFISKDGSVAVFQNQNNKTESKPSLARDLQSSLIAEEGNYVIKYKQDLGGGSFISKTYAGELLNTNSETLNQPKTLKNIDSMKELATYATVHAKEVKSNFEQEQKLFEQQNEAKDVTENTISENETVEQTQAVTKNQATKTDSSSNESKTDPAKFTPEQHAERRTQFVTPFITKSDGALKLNKQIEVELEGESGKVRKKKMSVGEVQKELQNKQKAIEKLLDCISR